VSTTFETLPVTITFAKSAIWLFSCGDSDAEFAANGLTVNALVEGDVGGPVVDVVDVVDVVAVALVLLALYSATQSTCVDWGVVGQELGLLGFGATPHHVCC
jgi:hypothetical protein